MRKGLTVYIALAGFKLESSSFSLLSTGITGMGHHTRFIFILRYNCKTEIIFMVHNVMFVYVYIMK
jgi:hypothetical protein